MCARVWVCVHMRVQGSEEDRGDTDLSLQTLSLIEPGAGLVVTSPKIPPVYEHLSPRTSVTACLDFHVGPGGLNSGLLAYATSAFSYLSGICSATLGVSELGLPRPRRAFPSRVHVMSPSH